MAAHTDAFENKQIDFMFRGQALGLANTTAAAGTGPAKWHVALFTAAGSDASPGAEVSGNGYARVPYDCTLANWAGTQGAGTTTASTGSSGTTSNNNAITFPTPTGPWGQVVEWGLFDSASGGTECIRAPLGAAKTINNGDPAPSFAPGALTYKNDD